MTAGFAHHQQGPAGANNVLRGLIFGLFAFTGFFLTIASLIDHIHLGLAFLAATLIALAIQAISLWLMRKTR